MSFNPLPSSQQPWAPPPPAPPARSGTTRVLVFGCLGLVMLTVLGVAASVFLLGTKLVGSSLASTPVTPAEFVAAFVRAQQALDVLAGV